jgi:hypothetical protein
LKSSGAKAVLQFGPAYLTVTRMIEENEVVLNEEVDLAELKRAYKGK